MSRHLPPAETPPSANIRHAGTIISLFSQGAALEKVSRAGSKRRAAAKIATALRCSHVGLDVGLAPVDRTDLDFVTGRAGTISNNDAIPISGKSATFIKIA